MSREAEIIAFLRSKYAKHFEALDNSLGLADEFADHMSGHPLSNRVILVSSILFSSLLNNCTAASHLLKQGFGLQSGMLVRPALEDVLNIVYIVNNQTKEPEELARRFLLYQRMTPIRTAKTLQKLGVELSDEQTRVVEESKQIFRADFPDGNDDDWSGRNGRTKAQEGGIEDVYLLLYPLFSTLIHGGPESWTQITEETEAGSAYYVGPHDIYINEPIPALCHLLLIGVKALLVAYDSPQYQLRADTMLSELKILWD